MCSPLAAAYFKLNADDAVVSTVHLDSLDNASLRVAARDYFPLHLKLTLRYSMWRLQLRQIWTVEQANLQLDFIDFWAALHDLSAEPGHIMSATPRFPV
jgi:hypothetical protein